MALVRCPRHNLPYNNDNPRGCPACAQEESGTPRASLMSELARSTRGVEVISELPETKPAPSPPPTLSPEARRRVFQFGIPAIVVLGTMAVVFSGPRFVDAPSPTAPSGQVRPLPLQPGQDVTVMFAQLGTQPPAPHPTARTIERYQYGEDMIIDAINGYVYSIHLELPNRTWQGIQVGMGEQTARGALALLGTPTENDVRSGTPQLVGRYQVYPSLDDRPQRTLTVPVRPPNGCYDVVIDLRPRALGVVEDGGERYAAVARSRDDPTTVVTKIQVIDRSRVGPLGTAVRSC